MQIKHSLKRHLIGAGILGAVALIAFTGGDAPASGGTAATGDSAQATAAASARLAAMTPVAHSQLPQTAPPAAALSSEAQAQAPQDTALQTALPPVALSAEAQAQALQRTVLQTERQVAALRRQGGDANAVYRLRTGALPAATVAGLMQREDAEAGSATAGNGTAALPPLLRQD
ncbi:Stk19 family serine/threonine-protein kinase [Massilia sp. MB5]|uniref:Stk19 family serine/threonine-protein kinase n=1 Tax=Massilia sp. MB5 TaxID=2919578 RepID=UPI001F106393|nr:Stk19 family serine/threonine-protein kinase [Massilia sp. MB5]UMR33016.1 Stk19 family serine/threonine-protein kinase [Massilia sp. MB5]